MYARLLKPTMIDGRPRGRGYIGEVDEAHAETLKRESRAQVFATEIQAELAERVDEELEWNDIRTLASDVRDAYDDDASEVGDRRFELVEYIARYADEEAFEKFMAAHDEGDSETEGETDGDE